MKRWISITIVMVLLITCIFGMNVCAEDESWNYVYTAEDLYAVRENLSANYMLMADINLSETTAENCVSYATVYNSGPNNYAGGIVCFLGC